MATCDKLRAATDLFHGNRVGILKQTPLQCYLDQADANPHETKVMSAKIFALLVEPFSAPGTLLPL
jgi:hypothetical protein